MAQFQVPQFIETEDKIIWILTLRQFLYLIGAAGAAGLGFLMFQPVLAVFFAVLFAIISICMAFVKINGRDLNSFIKSAFSYYWNPRLYIFKIQRDDGQHVKSEKLGDLTTSHHTSSGLRELGDQLQTSRWSIPKRELAKPPQANQPAKEVQEKYEILSKATGDKEMARRIDFR